MKENVAVYPALSSAEQPDSLKILSKFQVNDDQFLVICLETDSDTQFSKNTSSHPLNAYVELSRFEVEGHLCAIVKAKPAEQLGNSIDINLTALLTERELQIAVLVASGRANKQIATQLSISEWTVSTHLRRTFIKLGVDSRAAMVYKCAPIIQKLVEKVEGFRSNI